MRKKSTVCIYIFVILFTYLVGGDVVFASVSFPTGETIKMGMSGASVASLQQYLSGIGFYSKDMITGYFGPLTQKAVWYFQKYSGIGATGIVDQKTDQKIRESLVATSSINSVSETNFSTSTVSINGSSTLIGSSTTTLMIHGDYHIQERPDYDLRRLALQIQNLINDKRAEFKLDPVSWDEELVDVPREHSIDQAKDNIDLTNRSLACSYPIIRHEGFTPYGYSLKDRLASRYIRYRYAGENIAMVPLSKNLLYLNPTDKEIEPCDKVDKFEPGEGTEEERTKLFREVLNKSEEAVKKLVSVVWVNKEWRTEKELAEMTVDGWMNSPGHRDNILRPEYSTAAIGIAIVNDYIIITHDFLGY
ncbi:MAG: peptidoglycan-binding protein [Candidatus Vogelbacteria bacterium]|nr:peptidoglycan-binding protein [Candidatus Vogelbacteria bacterium]